MLGLPHLSDCFWPLARPEAFAFLKQARSMLEYLDCYREVFPQDHQQSMTLIEQGHASFFPARSEVYASHEQRFLTCIHQTLFRLADDLDEFFLNAEERCFFIPVNPIGFDDVYLYGGYDIEPGVILLLYLMGYADEDTFVEHFVNRRGEDPARLTEQAKMILALPLAGGEMSEKDLAEACEREQGPLAGLKATLDMLAHDSGNVWLDATSEMPPDNYAWTASTLLSLASDYRLARKLAEQTSRLLTWLEADPVAHFQEVVTLWNRCV